MPKKRKDLQPVVLEPLGKRQRKLPAWQQVEDTAAQTSPAGHGQPAGEDEEEVPQLGAVLEYKLINPSQLEVVILRDGKRYKGVMDRTGLPHGIGVPAEVDEEELEAIKAAPPHGQNPNNLCALCNLPLEKPPVTGISDDKAGQYVKAKISTNWVARVHLQCGVWCPEVHPDEHFPDFLHNMGKAVRRGRGLKCRMCHERGATLGCWHVGCSRVYHLPCAPKHGCHMQEQVLEEGEDGNRYEFWCPQHLPRGGKKAK